MNKPFYKDGVLINAPVNNADNKIIVKDKATGGMVVLDRPQDFNSKYHERVAKVAVESVKPVELVEPVEPVSRFEELKAKGYVNLNKAEREEYKSLKARHDA